ncbi:hypothetical protein [Methylobacter tundripaludum]|uniref:DUF3618 domain-containing protein n=1 Tax=Methylobacter tundripaludum (strain ATCC BAA-1195 / DSM 17260 / SV96) TaxID=697282 RepID=G3IW07_METTV|nr:hypothetical protein [Methylobacter tundripaludum]EGW21818.1 hypothetical protein Mettu_0607 [Methylobacter tundripaludum SV96]
MMPKSLTAQINAAERQVLNRQQEVGIRTTTLVRKIHQQMIAPATLLLAGGIGFIIGELTKRQTSKKRPGTVDKPQATESSPLRIALNLITSARTLYTALPLVWMMKSYRQPDASGQTPAPYSQPMATPSAVHSRRRSRYS